MFNTEGKLADHIFQHHVNSEYPQLHQRGDTRDRWVKAISKVRVNVHKKARQDWTDVLSKLKEAKKAAEQKGDVELATFRQSGIELLEALLSFRSSPATWNSEAEEGVQKLVDAIVAGYNP